MKKQEIIKNMVAFWDENSVKAADYPSIDFWYKDGSYLKMFIQPREIYGIPVAACVLAYASQSESIETPSFAPVVMKTGLENSLKKVLTNFQSQGVDIEKDIERIGYVL